VHQYMIKAMVLTTFGALLAIPAQAEIRVDLGALNIHIANDAPPAERREARTSRPDRESVWIKGYWDRQDNRWEWVQGRWERPAQPNARWVSPRYTREGTAWRYEPAHWSHQQLVEGDDYRQWRKEHSSDSDRSHDEKQHAIDSHNSDERHD